jgi:hypothetical protein
MARPSSFHAAVIDAVHRLRGPFSLSMIRHEVGIKDPKTARVIMTRLASMGYVMYLTNKAYGVKRWTITKKWPNVWESPQVVKNDYTNLQIMRRVIKGGR